MTARGWASRPAPEVARERLLDAAGRCFVRHGPAATTLSMIAAEAGCSRPTVYRYFADRDSLRVAFIRRAARELGASIRAELDTSAPPREWLTDAVLAALAGVRSDETLAAWFVPDDVGTTLALASSATLVGDLASLLPGERLGVDEGGVTAEWVVRAILSLLANPASDPGAERRLVDRLVRGLLAG